MPSNPVVLSCTGPSTNTGYPMWMPDTNMRPFAIGIGCVVNSTGVSYQIEHTFDYNGNLSSDFTGWKSSLATWFPNTGITAQSSNSNGNYAFPVSAIRLNVISGSTLVGNSVTATLIQAG